MKVSVVIPAHNEAEYIKKTLEAVLAQDFPEPFEVIVVDNASTDATAAIVRQFRRVKLFYEPVLGLPVTRERGRKEAKGDIFVSLDADSIPPSDWLAKGMRFFENPRIVAVSGPYSFYDAPFWFRYSSFFVQRIGYRVVHEILHTICKKGAIMQGGNFFVRASVLEAIGGFDKNIFFHGEDTDTAVRVAAHGKIMYRGDMTVWSSARRFQHEGVTQTFGVYVINFLWVLLFHRPFTKK